MSLANAPVSPTIRVSNLEAAKDFYGNKLGLKESGEQVDEGGVLYEAGGGTKLFIYEGPLSSAAHTLAAFKVGDVVATVKELKEKGIEFESYDSGPIKTDENNIAHYGNAKSAWFKDPDGHILSVADM